MSLFKKFLMVVVFLFLASYCVFANSLFIDSRPGISGGFGGAFTLPTADYLSNYPGNSDIKMPPVRTSYTYNVDIRIVDIVFGFNDSFSNAISFGAGVSFIGVSSSLAFGSSILNAYHGVGLFIKGNATFGRMEMGLAAKLFKCEFLNTKNAFLAGEVEIYPSYELARFSSVKLSLALPVSILFKTDSLVMRFSCGVSIDYSVRGFKGGDK